VAFCDIKHNDCIAVAVAAITRHQV